VYATKGIAAYAAPAEKAGADVRDIGRFIVRALFATSTNVNFVEDRLVALLREAGHVKDDAQACCADIRAKPMQVDPACWQPAARADMIRQAANLGISPRLDRQGADVTALQEMLTYGLKGMAAYAEHARLLGYENRKIYDFFIETLAILATEPDNINELMNLNMKVGEVNLAVMELLDKAHTGTYGIPAPTRVRLHPRKGKAILVSGHDLAALAELLEQTIGTGIHVYTHGEMLPAHGYPGLKKHAHLAGHYGGAWHDQQTEFDDFPGAILMTTNCIQEPRDAYKHRIFTTGLVALPGVEHIRKHQFGPLIGAALEAKGFFEDGPDDTILVGFGHQAVLDMTDKIVTAIKKGRVRHMFLIGGCDGASPGRNYYTEFAALAPADTVILTLACSKFRFNKMSFGTIDDIPRLLDLGQCNDAYSAIQIALALAHAFDTDINSLPLSFLLSCHEQKAVCLLLTLLHLGIRNIRLGPNMPAFMTPAMQEILGQHFNLIPSTTPEADLQAMLA